MLIDAMQWIAVAGARALSEPRSTRGAKIPPGAIMVARFPADDNFGQLVQAAFARPLWVPLVVLAPGASRHELRYLLSALQIQGPHGVQAIPWEGTTLPAKEQVCQAVGSRAAPTRVRMAVWVSRRFENHRLLPVVLAAMEANPLAWSDRTLRRRVNGMLRCRPSDLRRLADLASIPRLQPTVERLAAAAGTTPTRLRERVSDGLGLTLREFNRTPAWECIMEAAVRKGLGAGGWGLGADRS